MGALTIGPAHQADHDNFCTVIMLNMFIIVVTVR
jgi:hypothetical protein